jgi:hydroxyacylglutathione hydrolase
VCGEEVRVIDVPGHTVGHVAFHLPRSGYLFSADSLMALGCGRLFEGTPQQMWDSLQRLRALPADTVVCSGHEYTESNARFALSVDPGNEALQERAERVRAARARGEPTVPSRLAEEAATNPFLRADDPALKAAMGMAGRADAEVFAALRKAKDNF